MTLLRDKSRSIQFEAFHVFKVFVANPKKTQPIMDILIRNKDKLIVFLNNFHNDKGAYLSACRTPHIISSLLFRCRGRAIQRGEELLAEADCCSRALSVHTYSPCGGWLRIIFTLSFVLVWALTAPPNTSNYHPT